MTPAMRTAHSPLGTTLHPRQAHKLPLRAIFGATQGPAVLTPPRAMAYTALMQAVASAAERVPCLNRPDLGWLSEDDTEATAAAAACTKCPALAECARYAKTHLQDSGVWGGQTLRQRRPHRNRKATTR